ncbi:MAG: RidA family protein [Anaerolineales bacterium]|nr:RidA family protein [Anaerolineales bacterium]
MDKSGKKIVSTDEAPEPIGPYSAGVRYGNMVFTAGQIGIDPKSGEVVTGGIEAETRQVLKNLEAILKASGASLGQVVKTTVFLRDLGDFSAMNAVYGEFFRDEPPARSTVEAGGLPKGVAVEIEAIAFVNRE